MELEECFYGLPRCPKRNDSRTRHDSPPSIQTRTVIPQPGQTLVQVLLGTDEALCPATDFRT